MAHRAFGLFAIIAVWTVCLGAAEPSLPSDLKLDVIRRGYDGTTCMTQARVGIVPRDGEPPLLVATMTEGIDCHYGRRSLSVHAR